MKAKGRPSLDLAGMSFWRLTAIEVVDKDTDGSVMWLCSCVCGGTKKVRAYLLRSGQVKSCGCLRRQTATENLGAVHLRQAQRAAHRKAMSADDQLRRIEQLERELADLRRKIAA